MNWFKETWWLVKQLFTTTKNKDKVQYKHMDHYPFSGYSAMSWCGYILTKKKESDIKTTTWNHENIHLQQAKDKGSWLKYYADYVWEWIKGNPINQYIHQDNPSWNKSELDKITKQFKGKLRDKNPIDPENTSYFMNWMEQNAYGINMLDRLKELNIKPTKQNILKYLKSLPDTDSIKKAALQFKNLDDYIKWLNTMPLADNGNINEIENYNFA